MTDDQLQSDVRVELAWNHELDARHIVVSAEDGAVTLSGFVPSYFEKTRAVETAEHVYGVKAVADEIDVRLHAAHEKEDAEIAKSVAHILAWSTVLADQRIKATVSNGHVTLTGEVGWDYQRQEASRAIERVLGVKSVANRITVKPRVPASEVEKHITNALARNAALDARQIHVTTLGNKAVLTGHVHSLTEDRIAKNAAWQAKGIAEVEDRLVIQP
ncbi:MAG: BON domain-containing protein [Acidimicrobiales bacterium]|jgi:osmotically-inducible protein OsmY